MKCDLCKIKPARKKYCSVKCIKRAWYLKNNPEIRSYLNNNPKFWESETGIGFKWEKYAAKLLKAKHLEFNNGPDLDWNGIGVDVKVCNLYKRKNKRNKKCDINKQKGWWVFNKNNDKKEVKYFFCICLKEDGNIEKQLLIPSNKFLGNGITVGSKSKFDEFIFI